MTVNVIRAHKPDRAVIAVRSVAVAVPVPFDRDVRGLAVATGRGKQRAHQRFCG